VTDIWGSAVPTWISAVGGLASVGVATAALILSLGNRKGAASLAEGLNETNRAGGESVSAATRERVTWEIDRVEKGRYTLKNLSGSQTVTLTGATDVSIDSDGAFQLLQALPIEIAPQGTIPFAIDKSLVSSAVTAIHLEWVEDDGVTRSQTLYR